MFRSGVRSLGMPACDEQRLHSLVPDSHHCQKWLGTRRGVLTPDHFMRLAPSARARALLVAAMASWCTCCAYTTSAPGASLPPVAGDRSLYRRRLPSFGVVREPTNPSSRWRLVASVRCISKRSTLTVFCTTHSTVILRTTTNCD